MILRVEGEVSGMAFCGHCEGGGCGLSVLEGGEVGDSVEIVRKSVNVEHASD